MMILVNNVQYYVEEKGNGEPVIFLHGFTGDTTTWQEVSSFFEPNYRCIFIDIIGHGNSDSPEDVENYKMDHVARDLNEILERLGIAKIHIIGYSMGGRLALTYSVLFPNKVQSLVLESSSPGLRTEKEQKIRREADQKLAKLIEKEGMESFVMKWENIPLFDSQKKLSKEKQEIIRRQRLGQNPIGLSNSLRGMGTGSQQPLWDKLSNIDFPTLLTVGSLDTKFCEIAKEMKLCNPNFRVSTFDDVGHAIHVEEPRKFGTIINEFLINT